MKEVTVTLTDKSLRHTVEYLINSIDTELCDYDHEPDYLRHLATIVDHAEVMNSAIDNESTRHINADTLEALRFRIRNDLLRSIKYTHTGE